MSDPVKPKWSWKTWMVGALVAIGVASTWAVNKLSDTSPVIPTNRWDMGCASSHVVFDQKKRCGFLDLSLLVEAEGEVLKTKIHNDGDFSINIKLDEEYEYLLYYGDRKTRGYLHVEFMPCERQYVDVEEALQEVASRHSQGEIVRVRVTGRWAYDGVDHRGAWRDQLGNCLGGREADPQVGWTEIHPAYTVEIL